MDHSSGAAGRDAADFYDANRHEAVPNQHDTPDAGLKNKKAPAIPVPVASGIASSINQESLRNHNLSVVLRSILHAKRPLSRANLADQTGLTKATISMLIAILQRNAVVSDLQIPATNRFGRPSTPIGFAPRTWAGLGTQINTDGYGYIIKDFTGEVLSESWAEKPMLHADPEQAFSELDALIRPAAAKLRRQGCHIIGGGLALPGLVADGSILLRARNLGWDHIDISQFKMVNSFGLHAVNEANLAAIAQIPGYATCEADKGSPDEEDTPVYPQSFIYISTDIGIGGAYVRNGQVVSGDHGFAGELGHVSVNFNGPLCRCGRNGCAEMYAGRQALVEAADIAYDDAAAAAESLNELLSRWGRHDPRAESAVDQAVRALSSVIASTVNTVDVDTAMLGGFWARVDNSIVQRISAEVNHQVLGSEAMDIQVIKPQVNDHPALHGAAEVGLRRVVENPLSYIEVSEG
ncbi:ROK family protein [Scardovia wiggsiae]|uniref:ROK family protein n=1 Tax=Scardovia wiggsiae TaxID=230143 RepID=UPI003BAD6B98